MSENTKTNYSYHQFYLKPLQNEFSPVVFHREVLTIGRSETCDVQIDNPYLSHVHASIFFRNGDFFLTDLNSTNGTYVNDERIKVSQLKIGDTVRFGSVKFQLLPVQESKVSDPEKTLDTMNILQDAASMDLLTESVAPPAFRENPVFQNQELEVVPAQNKDVEVTQVTSKRKFQLPQKMVPVSNYAASANQSSIMALFTPVKPTTPLDLIPELNFSEFIFEEDVQGNALDFTGTASAIEITTFVEDFVVSIDYFDSKKKQLVVSGGDTKNEELFFPALKKNQKFVLLKYVDHHFYLKDLKRDENFQLVIFTKNGPLEKWETEQGYIRIESDYIVTLQKDNFHIVLKETSSPPNTLPVPFVLFDAFLNRVIAFFMVFYAILMVAISMIPPRERELDQEKVQLDRIVYVPQEPPKIIIPPAPTVSVSEKSPGQDLPKSASMGEKTQKRSMEVEDPNLNKPKGDTAVSLPKITNNKITKPVVPPAVAQVTEKSNTAQSKNPTTKAVQTSLDAKEEIPPRLDIKSLQSKLGKNLQNSGVGSNIVSNTHTNNSDLSEGPRSLVGANQGTQVRDVGILKSNTTATVNVEGVDKGDLGVGKSIPSSLGGDIGMFDGSGSRKVMLGVLDPNGVRDILRRYIPSFQFCYEQELERTNKKIATTLVLEFSINQEGRAINDKYSSKNFNFSDSGISCFRKVLSGIQFDKPKGNAVVGIKQPINMEPKY